MSEPALARGLRTALLCLAITGLTGCQPAPRAPRAMSGADWAYPFSPPAPNPPAPLDKVTRLRVEGSDVTYTAPELRNLFAAPDWRPQDHPAMPPVVAGGRRPEVMACGYCHLPSGDGRPENAALAGLPRDYIVEQMRDFRSGARHSSIAGRGPTMAMAKLGKAATDADIAAAADYFSTLTHRSFTRVVESDQVPRTVTKGWLYSRDPGGGSEPIGARIIEIPEDFARFEKRDPATSYVAYVPTGAIARGAALARTWGGGKQACGLCHGSGFKGVGPAPPLAGRSPTYIVRQLNDFRTGARSGPGGAVMKAVVASMLNEDMIALAAFMGSREP